MSALVGTETQLVDRLVHLVELDLIAVSAYQAAIERVGSPRRREALQEFQLDHERHARDLRPLIVELDGQPPDCGDLSVLVDQGRAALGKHLDDGSGDAAVLRALLASEAPPSAAYERAAERTDMHAHTHALLLRCLDDERRHRAWLEYELSRTQRERDAPRLDPRSPYVEASSPVLSVGRGI